MVIVEVIRRLFKGHTNQCICIEPESISSLPCWKVLENGWSVCSSFDKEHYKTRSIQQKNRAGLFVTGCLWDSSRYIIKLTGTPRLVHRKHNVLHTIDFVFHTLIVLMKRIYFQPFTETMVSHSLLHALWFLPQYNLFYITRLVEIKCFALELKSSRPWRPFDNCIAYLQFPVPNMK